MKPYDRLLAAVGFEEYDRPPLSDNDWNEKLPEMVPYLANCPERADRRYGDEERAAAVRASQDMIPYSHIYDHRFPVLGPTPPSREGEVTIDADGFELVVHDYTQWVRRRPFSDVPGFLAYIEAKTEQVRRDRPALPEDFVPRLAHAREMLGDTCIAIPFLGAGLDALYRLGSWEIFGPAILAYPEVIAAYLDALSDRTVKLLHLYAEHITARHCPVGLGAYSDVAWNGGLLLAPRLLRQVLIPAVAKIARAYHAHGIRMVYHSEGNIRQFVADLAAAGADGINPLSPSEGMDAVEIRRLYPDLVLWGGIDERAILVDGTPADVRAEVRRVVAGVGKGLILSSSGGLHPACRADNCLAMVQAAAETTA
ncbi:MAG: uroporphyrinogen decarboxylase family protein [Anaerolineae bacterium]